MCLGDMAEVWKALGKSSLVQHSQHPHRQDNKFD